MLSKVLASLISHSIQVYRWSVSGVWLNLHFTFMFALCEEEKCYFFTDGELRESNWFFKSLIRRSQWRQLISKDAKY